ncbi:hypothetical protein Q8A73_017839 [Channa argus]|nr:hypothetical protein Q8A73_017839 [Channa argus]
MEATTPGRKLCYSLFERLEEGPAYCILGEFSDITWKMQSSRIYTLHLSITSDLRAAANGLRRRRSVAKGEVWLSLRVAAIQRRWLKRLDCQRLSVHFLWNLNRFGWGRFVIHKPRDLTGHLLGRSGDHSRERNDLPLPCRIS